MKRLKKDPTIFDSEVRTQLGITRFVLNINGEFLEIDSNIKQFLGLGRNQMVSRPITDFVIPQFGQDVIDILQHFSNWHAGDKSPRSISLTMKVENADPLSSLSRSPMVQCIVDRSRDPVVVQGIFMWVVGTMPLYRRLNSIMYAMETGYVFLDPQGRILGSDATFAEHANIVLSNLDEIRGVPFKSLVDPFYITDNWLNDQPVITYLKKTAEQSSNPWKQIYSMQGKSSAKILQDWILCPLSKVKCNDGTLRIHSKSNELGENYAILKIPVNIPDYDLRITYECASPNPSDLSPMLGGSNVSRYIAPDRRGYLFGFGCKGSLNSLQKRTVVIKTNKKVLPQPNVWHKCVLERVGGRFVFEVDNVPVFEYYDSQPIFEACQYFSFYHYSIKASLKNVAVYTRKSIMNYEKVARMNRHQIAFKNNPGKLFEMRWTVGYWLHGQARLIMFKDISNDLNIEAQNQLLKKEGKNARLDLARKYIAEHFKRKINFKELCNTYYMSYSNFITAFAKNFGAPPKNYQTNLRLRSAKQMLRSRQYKIKDIAYLNGYEDDQTFYQLFARHEGMSPSEYMKKHTI